MFYLESFCNFENLFEMVHSESGQNNSNDQEILTIPYKLSFFTWQGSTAVDPMWALTVVAFLLTNTQLWSDALTLGLSVLFTAKTPNNLYFLIFSYRLKRQKDYLYVISSTMISISSFPLVTYTWTMRLLTWCPLVIHIETIRWMMEIITTMTSLAIMVLAMVGADVIMMVIKMMIIVMLTTPMLTSLRTLHLVPTIKAI